MTLLADSPIVSSINADIAAARKAIAETNDEIAKEKSAILNEISTIQTECQTLGKKSAAFDDSTKQTKTDAKGIQRQIAELKNEKQQIERLLDDFQTQLLLWKTPGAPELGAISDLESTIKSTSANIKERIGGSTVPSFFLMPDGTVSNGEIMRFGPVMFLHSYMINGIAATEAGAVYPSLINVGAKDSKNIQWLFTDKCVATVPMDITGGDALSLQSQGDSIAKHIAKGGPTMIPILLLGVLCLLLAFYKISFLIALPKRDALLQIHHLADALSNSKSDEAAALCGKLPAPLKQLANTCIESFNLEKDALEERLFAATLAILPKYEKYLSLLAVSASAAPLLGLLGTVTGMIHTFKLITIFGTGDARLLSSGISEALITTEAGLIVAIPALLIHAWCNQRCRRLNSLLHESAIILLNAKPNDK